MHSRYRTINQEEKNEDNVNEEVKKKIKAEKLEKLNSKFHAILWILLALIVGYYTNIMERIIYDKEVNKFYLGLALICIFANLIIIFYLTIYLPLIQKIKIPWDIYCPNLIPISTFLGILSLILLNISLWNLYGILTPLIIIILFMGLIFSTHFIPWPC